MSSAFPDLVLLSTWSTEQLRRRSVRRRSTLFVCVSGSNLIARNGKVAKADSPRAARLIVALLLSGALTNAEMAEVLFGDDPTGGPERADQAVSVAIKGVRLIAAALGLKLTRCGHRGLELVPVALEEAA